MIISDKHRFIFIQVQATGSSCLGDFFIREFSGIELLRKHASVLEFMKVASVEQKAYKKIIGIRNPLDRATTRFVRNHLKSINRAQSVGKIQELFDLWFHKNYISKARGLNASYHLRDSYPFVDYTIRQEYLLEDLVIVLNELNLSTEVLPQWRKKTDGKNRDYISYYSDSLIPVARELFKEEMSMHCYDVPDKR